MKAKSRVVITGLGVVCANGVNVESFKQSLFQGRTGIEHLSILDELEFRCQNAGVPPLSENDIQSFLSSLNLSYVKSSGIAYGLMAGKEAMRDASISFDSNQLIPRMGCIFGTGSNAAESSELQNDYIHSDRVIDNLDILPIQSLASGVSIYLNKIFGFGGEVTTNSSACSTGTEGLLMAYDYISEGLIDKMLIGSSESSSPFVWSPFDAMFATSQGFNEHPELASCPLSANATGFVPSAGAGALVVESLDSALARGAHIYVELLGGEINSGGQRKDGSMTLGNSDGMVRCIQHALQNAGVISNEIDFISGHLTSTIGDVREVQSLYHALDWKHVPMPFLNSTKSMIGHSLSASGSIETIALILQMCQGFVHPSLNAFPLHPEIEPLVALNKIPTQTVETAALQIGMKISLGFGDVNACLLLKKMNLN